MENKSPLTLQEQAVVRALQQDLPLVPEPYRAIAEDLGMTEEELLAIIESLKERGCLKRISIALRHNNVGYKINVMAVWHVDEERIDDIGAALVRHRYVTHCYKRAIRPQFPYNLYTMLHARSEEEFAEIIADLRQTMEELMDGPVDYQLLRSLRELKKTGMKYFIEKPDEIFFDD